jgi:hypothetical protein
MKIRQYAAPSLLAMLLAVSGTSVFAASVSDVVGRSSDSVSGSTISVNTAIDVATTAGRGNIARKPASAALPALAGGQSTDFGRA